MVPVVDPDVVLRGVLTLRELREPKDGGDGVLEQKVGEMVKAEPFEAFPDETLREVVYRMAEDGVTRLPVVERDTGKLQGMVSLDDLLKARTRHMEEERRREQTIKFRFRAARNESAEETPTAV